MTKLNLLLGLSLISTITLTAEEIPNESQNKNNYYIGASLDYQRIYNHDPKLIDIASTQDNLGGLALIIGYKNLFDSSIENKDFSLDIEGRVTKSFFEESFADSLRYSLFAKPQYTLHKKLKVYGLLGFGYLNIEGHNGEVPAHKDMIGKEIYSDVSFQWGLGINTDITKDLSLFIDYTSLINNADIDSTLYGYDPKIYKKLSGDAINIGVTYKFNLNDIKN